MSIFGSIVSKIFGHSQAAQPSGTADSPAAAASAGTTSAGAPDDSPGAPAATSLRDVDVAGILDGLAAKSAQRLDWQHSIVDLMKLLGLDSSLEARKGLAQELHFDGSTADSAAMNIWLHRQVMQQLAQHGGKVPEELRR